MSRSRARAPSRTGKLESLLSRAVGTVFPAYQACVSIGGEIVFESAGGLVQAPGATFPPVDASSVFDLASMTKALATVSCCMAFRAAGRLPLDAPLTEILGRPVAGGSDITPRRLLTHTSGLPPWRPFHLEVPRRGTPSSRRSEILRAARDTNGIVPAGSAALYSDVGFLQLTALVEHLGGKRLDRVFAELVPATGLSFRPLAETDGDRRVSGLVPTELDAVRGLLVGRVNDENAFAMGGVSGHAGLFGNAAAVRRYAQTLLDAHRGRASWIPQEIVREFWRRQAGPGTWALGWDTPSRSGSSAGSRPPVDAVGHLGFTGTSIWLSPAREAIAVLLTNRVWPDRSNEKLKAFRPRFHDLVWAMA